MKIDIKDIIFWIFLVLALGLLIWNIFGNSPSEFLTLIAILFTILLKVESIAIKQAKSETKFGNLCNSFKNLVKDFKEHVRR